MRGRAESCDKLFVYGSLRDPGLRARLLGRGIAAVDAILADFELRRGRYWYVVAAEGQRVAGLVLENLSSRDFAILDEYEECPSLYTRELRAVARDDGARLECWVYLPAAASAVRFKTRTTNL
jgi:gamma-glutamylcyclotransferase (GGCT)/AIG2-like uncharacterized protein YtfP